MMRTNNQQKRNFSYNETAWWAIKLIITMIGGTRKGEKPIKIPTYDGTA